jgi:low temperature requirement protein LtrA
MSARNTDEHRSATAQDLFFELCFIVAVAQAGIAVVHVRAGDLVESHRFRRSDAT